MAKAGEVKITIEADVRPAISAMHEAADRVVAYSASGVAARSAAYGRMYRRQLNGAAEYFDKRQEGRARLSPGRLIDKAAARVCRLRAARIYAPDRGAATATKGPSVTGPRKEPS